MSSPVFALAHESPTGAFGHDSNPQKEKTYFPKLHGESARGEGMTLSQKLSEADNFAAGASPPQKKSRLLAGHFFVAEKKGFEPLIPLWGIHDFQSCALDQLRDFSTFAQDESRYSLVSLAIIMQERLKVKEYFLFLQKSSPAHIISVPCAKYR